MEIWLIYKVDIDVRHSLDMAIYVLNQLKNDSDPKL